MKNMYAVKCLYKYSYYNQENELIEEVIPSWEERIILIKADNMDDADKKSIIFAKEYENEYINVNNQIVKVELYEILDIFTIFDNDEKNNMEVYSKMFDANQEEIENMLDILYPLKEKWFRRVLINETSFWFKKCWAIVNYI